jgi:hypothetical protein
VCGLSLAPYRPPGRSAGYVTLRAKRPARRRSARSTRPVPPPLASLVLRVAPIALRGERCAVRPAGYGARVVVRLRWPLACDLTLRRESREPFY